MEIISALLHQNKSQNSLKIFRKYLFKKNGLNTVLSQLIIQRLNSNNVSIFAVYLKLKRKFLSKKFYFR